MTIKTAISGFIIFSVVTQGLNLLGSEAQAEELPVFRSWIQDMKQRARGPFTRLRWYCEDGTVLPPEPYACVPHGGGVQHGELSDRAVQIRAAGYYIANVLAGGKGATMGVLPGERTELIHTLLEQYLIRRDDGWIFRGARTYRGAIQGENESAAARALLYRLAQLPSLPNQDFLLVREAFRLLPGRLDTPEASKVRELSTTLAENDPGFASLRAKIHGQPQASDAKRVRDYAERRGSERFMPDYEELAEAIDVLFRRADVVQALSDLKSHIRSSSLRQVLTQGIADFSGERQADKRMIKAAGLLADLRQGFSQEGDGNARLEILATGLILEQEVFRTGRQLPAYSGRASRLQQISWLSGLNDANYGVGLISARQWQAVKLSLERLNVRSFPLQSYHEELRYLGRPAAWAANWLGFHFTEGIEKYSDIEPKIASFIPDRLRGSPMLIYSQILDVLSADANASAGLHHTLFGKQVGTAIRPLNAGFAKGVLHLTAPSDGRYREDGVYVLAETTPELTPVAGILTRGEGNALSHVQLLASNLGVPNAVIADRLLDPLRRFDGQKVIMAVSPGGSVDIELDDLQAQDSASEGGNENSNDRISPDRGKLNLERIEMIPLSSLRAADSGRVAGPKAANLGELKHFFPKAVTEGVVIPFGVFRAYLNQPMAGGSESIYSWMLRQYSRLSGLAGEQKSRETERVLRQLRQQIESGEPGRAFRSRLSRAMEKTFGSDGSYAVFVRSDTNVEDLPGFTGAGLNLTLPNVRGFENVVNAVLRVWASPFTERAFSWRQQRMDHPELVFPSVLLLKSVAVDKSGVMLTMDPESGRETVLSIAVNHGIGGAVQGQQAEELRIDRTNGRVTVLNDATTWFQRVLSSSGGLVKEAVPADGDVLSIEEIQTLVELADKVDKRLPQRDASGTAGAADIEFGFKNGELVLFQIRPFLRDESARQHRYLLSLDAGMKQDGTVNLLKPPVRYE